MKNVALGQEEIPFCALSLLTMTSLRNPWALRVPWTGRAGTLDDTLHLTPIGYPAWSVGQDFTQAGVRWRSGWLRCVR